MSGDGNCGVIPNTNKSMTSVCVFSCLLMVHMSKLAAKKIVVDHRVKVW